MKYSIQPDLANRRTDENLYPLSKAYDPSLDFVGGAQG